MKSVSGSHQVAFHNEWCMRQVARMDWFRKARRSRVSRIRWRASSCKFFTYDSLRVYFWFLYKNNLYIYYFFFTILQIEDSMLRDQIERYNQRLRDFEERQKAYRAQQDRIPDQDLEVFNSIKNFFQFWFLAIFLDNLNIGLVNRRADNI